MGYIVELVEYADGELPNEDLPELEALQVFKQEKEERTEAVLKKFMVHGLARVISKINAVMLKLLGMDTNT